MKKFFLTILAFAYLVAASGMSINMHYCMEKLVSWSITGDHVKTCPSCHMDKEHGTGTHYSCKSCCKDQVSASHFEKVYKSEENIFSKFSFSKATIAYAQIGSYSLVPLKFIGSNKVNAPPRKHTVPNYIFNCVFRI